MDRDEYPLVNDEKISYMKGKPGKQGEEVKFAFSSEHNQELTS